MRRLKAKNSRRQQRLSESQEIELLEQWIEARKPDSGTNPLANPTPPPTAEAGRAADGGFSPYAGCKLFRQLPISWKTKDGLAPKYKEMSDIQRASLPHSLCGRDILGAAKTGSGKTLAFIIPVVEKLYRARWVPEDGVGSIIISPTKELAGQLFEELKIVGKHHSLSAGLLIGGRKDVDAEKERVNSLNILVCTPGRLLQHMNETPNFDCSQLQVLVLDEADRMLDKKFKGELDAIISQLPKRRQTLLFSATQTKSVKDLARLSLKDPEYISVHAESVTATPERLKQVAMEVPLDQKLNMLWSFIRSHLNSKMLVFLSSCKQVKFVYEAFKKLRPGISLKCLHGRMKQSTRMAIYLDFCEMTSVLFSTDVASRGLDFPAVDWVIQVDCPEDIAAYIHRVGRTARFMSEGKSVLFLTPSERVMLKKLQSAEPKIPIQLRKSFAFRFLWTLPSFYYSNFGGQTVLMQAMDHENKMEFEDERGPLPKEEKEHDIHITASALKLLEGNNDSRNIIYEEAEDDIFVPKKSSLQLEKNEPITLSTRILRKGKLKINVHRPLGTRLKYDEDGNQIAPLAAFADTENADGVLEPDKVKERYEKLREEKKLWDKEDKLLLQQRLREKRTKEKMKIKRWEEEEEDRAHSDQEEGEKDAPNRSEIHFESESDDGEPRKKKKIKGFDADAISLAEQEELALKLLSSMHS
ncbi:DEAD-box ATP-dependent RNA helicase 32 [Apostasia shenzhenica]|uniref:ATP-dependent RNA helicase n=1 Tax=Apostasia shenzhenica TaxID=1088818 RepID=A0A2H9ZTU6_9ASPA|nr:DEAD-box ATP-dependent RNA helicase 32 [Apostasia shenzhenica]